MMRRLLAAVFALLIAIVGLSLTTASAANLTVTTAPQVLVTHASACAAANASGSPAIESTAAGTGSAGSYSQVRLTNIPVDCQSLPIEVFVHGAGGSLLGTWSAGAAGSSAIEANVGDYVGGAVTSVVARIGGWLFPTAWTAPAPSNPTPPLGPVTCYQLDAAGNLITDAYGQGVQCDASPLLTTVHTWPGTLFVEYSISAPRSVLLVFDFSHSRYAAYDGNPASSSVSVVGYNGTNHLREGYDCSALPVLDMVAVHPRPHEGDNDLTGSVSLTSAPQWNSVCSN